MKEGRRQLGKGIAAYMLLFELRLLLLLKLPLLLRLIPQIHAARVATAVTAAQVANAFLPRLFLLLLCCCCVCCYCCLGALRDRIDIVDQGWTRFALLFGAIVIQMTITHCLLACYDIVATCSPSPVPVNVVSTFTEGLQLRLALQVFRCVVFHIKVR